MRIIITKADGSTEPVEVHPPMLSTEAREIIGRGHDARTGEVVVPLIASIEIDGVVSADHHLPKIHGPVTLDKIDAAAKRIHAEEVKAHADRAAFVEELLSKPLKGDEGLLKENGLIEITDKTGRVFRFETDHPLAFAIKVAKEQAEADAKANEPPAEVEPVIDPAGDSEAKLK